MKPCWMCNSWMQHMYCEWAFLYCYTWLVTHLRITVVSWPSHPRLLPVTRGFLSAAQLSIISRCLSPCLESASRGLWKETANLNGLQCSSCCLFMAIWTVVPWYAIRLRRTTVIHCRSLVVEGRHVKSACAFVPRSYIIFGSQEQRICERCCFRWWIPAQAGISRGHVQSPEWVKPQATWRDCSIIGHRGKVNACVSKLELWRGKFETGQSATAFPDYKSDKLTIEFTRDPSSFWVDNFPEEAEDIEEQFLDLVNDSAAKAVFGEKSLNAFCVTMHGLYPRIRFAQLVAFPATYLCKSAFLSTFDIKTKSQNHLIGLESDALCHFKSGTEHWGTCQDKSNAKSH